MFISKDKSGTYLLSVNKPERMRAHWKSIDDQYMVINSKFGEKIFPMVSWKGDPLEIRMTIDMVKNHLNF